MCYTYIAMPEVPTTPEGPNERPSIPGQPKKENVLDAQPPEKVADVAETTRSTYQDPVRKMEEDLGLTSPFGPGVPGEGVPEQRPPQEGEDDK